jgi:hypothetical protein
MLAGIAQIDDIQFSATPDSQSDVYEITFEIEESKKGEEYRRRRQVVRWEIFRVFAVRIWYELGNTHTISEKQRLSGISQLPW